MPRIKANRRKAGNHWTSRPAVFARLSIELLEDRTLPSQFGTLGTLADVASPPTSERVAGAFGQIPLAFEANQGQASPSIAYLARGPGYGAYLTPQGAVLNLSPTGVTPASISMNLIGAAPQPGITGLDPLATRSNYLTGNDPSRWHVGVPTFGGVTYAEIYPGVDLTFYGAQGQLEYDFLVQPGVDPGVIRLSFQGTEGMALDGTGNLVLHTAAGDLTEKAPVLYQQVGSIRQAVSGRYVVAGDQVSFAVGAYDPRLPLVIDPVVSFETTLGSGFGGSSGLAIAVDAGGNVYVTGRTTDPRFPLAGNPPQTTFAGGHDPRNPTDAFIAKLNPSGTALVYSTFLGGSGDDEARGLAIDSMGNVYVTGDTSSPDFPLVNAFQTTPSQAFVTELNAAGNAFVFSTYLNNVGGIGIAVDQMNSIYVAGGGIAKLNPNGAGLAYLTSLGPGTIGGATAIAVDSAGSAYVTGEVTSGSGFVIKNPLQPNYGGGMFDAIVAKLDPTGAIVYSTYLGGSGTDIGHGIAVDASGNAYVGGETSSGDFPTHNPFELLNIGVGSDGFVTEVNATGTALVYSTYLGGHDLDILNGIAVDAAGEAFVTGSTQSRDFPTVDQVQNSPDFMQHIFVAKIHSGGSGLIYSTYLSRQPNGFEEGAAIAVDPAGFAYVVGTSFQTHSDPIFAVFIAKLSATPGITATGPDVGGGPDVRVYNAKNGLLIREIVAYNPAFTGGVRVALGDVTGDGVPDIITAPGPGGGPDIRVFDGVTGALVREFFAYSPGFTGGVFVAAADLNHDGFAEIVTGPDSTGGPDIRVFDGVTGALVREFFAYNPGFTGGVRLALGDISGDTTPDIITAPGPTGGPDIRVYDFFQTGFLMREFFAYNPFFTGGVYVSAADLDGDGRADIITSPGAGGGPDVRVFSGATGAMIRELIAYSAGFTGGVRVATVDVNGDGVADIITSPGMTGGPDLRAFDGKTGAQIGEFLAYDAAFLGGVFVGGA